LLLNAILPFISLDVSHSICPTITAVLTVGHFWHRFLQQLDRLRLTTIYRDRTRPNETYIYTIVEHNLYQNKLMPMGELVFL